MGVGIEQSSYKHPSHPEYEGNEIYHNDLIDNTHQAIDDQGGNFGDNGYPSGGNYWSDYTGVNLYSGVNQDEPGSDGIGDAPYVIGVDQDNFPLMNPYNVNQPPESDSGSNQVIFDKATLDGSGSVDPDGTIISWEWSLTHRDNPLFSRSATGQTPTINNLSPGFYDVSLTITDDAAKTDTDTMVLGVAGTWDINGDDTIGLEEAIHVLQVVSRIR